MTVNVAARGPRVVGLELDQQAAGAFRRQREAVAPGTYQGEQGCVGSGDAGGEPGRRQGAVVGEGELIAPKLPPPSTRSMKAPTVGAIARAPPVAVPDRGTITCEGKFPITRVATLGPRVIGVKVVITVQDSPGTSPKKLHELGGTMANELASGPVMNAFGIANGPPVLDTATVIGPEVLPTATPPWIPPPVSP